MEENNDSTKKAKNNNSMMLTPSQAIRGSSGGSSCNPNNNKQGKASDPKINDNDNNNTKQNNNNNNNNNRNRRRRGNNRNQNQQQNNQKAESSCTEASNTNNGKDDKTTSDSNPGEVTSSDAPTNQQSNNRKKGGQRGGKKNKNTTTTNNNNKGSNQQHEGNKKNNPKHLNNNKNNNNNNKKPRKKYPWRRYIPVGTVDPITLENLQTLEYPPFALCADKPYVPVTWPVQDDDDDNKTGNNNNKSEDVGIASKKVPSEADLEELNRKRLAEQWGLELLKSDAEEENNPSRKLTGKEKSDSDPPPPPLSKRPYNLFDGRALAYYMVSQLQFIDPLNRRDLTRPELVNLDHYLVRHGLFTGDLKVTEAYDAKGVTLSSAGAAAATAQGRADIMQQMAQQLLNSLFVGHSVTTGRNNSATVPSEPHGRQASTLSLQEQYAALQRQEQEIAQQQQRQTFAPFAGASDFGADNIYGPVDSGAGFIVIDDDENPEMRGRNDFPSLSASAGDEGRNDYHNIGPFYSASHIADRYAGNGMRSSAVPSTDTAFPALSASSYVSNREATGAAASSSNNKKPPSKASKTLAKISGLVKKTDPEEKQRQWEAREAARRKAMMSNMSFGMNHSMADTSTGLLLPPQLAPDTITTASQEKIERNKAFAEALGVKPATQRYYKSGWARPTESNVSLDEFGNELDAALYPEMLIAAARERMPQVLKLEKKLKSFLMDDRAASLPLNPMDKATRALVHQYAEFWNLKTESFDPEPKRYINCVKMLETHTPYPLLTDAVKNWRGPLPEVPTSFFSDHTSQQTAGQVSKSRELSSSVADVANSRFDGLLEKERTKLQLSARTVPLELLPFESQQQKEAAAAYDAAEDLKKQQERIEEKRRRKREAEEKKKQLLEKVFASDDEENESKSREASSDNDSWGDEPEALFTGSDDED